MRLTEFRLRKIIIDRLQKSILEREDREQTSREKRSQRRSARQQRRSYSGPLVTVDGEKKYLGDTSIGMSEPGFWEDFRSRLETFVNNQYQQDTGEDLGLRIESLGVMRDLAKSAKTDNPLRVPGSKHGAGMAQDVYMHTDKYGEFTAATKFDPILAKDQDLVNAIVMFMDQSENRQLQWGGAFGSGSDALDLEQAPVGKGIDEFHHFEFKGQEIPQHFQDSEVAVELKKIGFSPTELTNTKALGKLYTALLEGEGMKVKIDKIRLRKILLEELERDRKLNEIRL